LGTDVYSGQRLSKVAIVLACIFLIVDVLKAGAWSCFEELEDPELGRLVDALPETMLQCRASSTTKKYLGAFGRWKLWARGHQLTIFPAKDHHVVLYLQHLAETTGSKAVEEAVYIIAWEHSLASTPSPTESSFVKVTLEGLRKSLTKPVTKKEPITVDMLKAMVTQMSSQHCQMFD